MEVAMKLLEKDIHEKQDTITSLRRQLDDIKLINLEMYKKLQASIKKQTVFDIFHKTQLYFGCECFYLFNLYIGDTICRLVYFNLILTATVSCLC